MSHPPDISTVLVGQVASHELAPPPPALPTQDTFSTFSTAIGVPHAQGVVVELQQFHILIPRTKLITHLNVVLWNDIFLVASILESIAQSSLSLPQFAAA